MSGFLHLHIKQSAHIGRGGGEAWPDQAAGPDGGDNAGYVNCEARVEACVNRFLCRDQRICQ